MWQAAGVRLNEFLDHLTLLTQKLQLSEAVNQVQAHTLTSLFNISDCLDMLL